MTTKEPLAALDAALNKSHHGEQVARKLEAFDDLVAACEVLELAYLYNRYERVPKDVMDQFRAALKKAKG